MKNIIGDIIENYLSKRIEELWEQCSKIGIKIPYTVEEAGFNSLLLTSIYDYIKEKEKGFSFAVSEAPIERYGDKGCRGDIIWYRENEVYYFELKGSCYGGSSAHADVKNAEKSMNYAKYQLEGINYKKNEKWYYQYEDSDISNINIQNRYGCCLGMIQSIIKDGKSNYNEIEKLLEKNENIDVFHKHKFFSKKLSLITDGDAQYKNDGYFIIGNVYEMINLK